MRKVPDDLAVIQIERDEVGKVLNISEGGLSFSSVTPVPRNLPVYFWVSFNLRDRIEAMGEVAWTDISRTIGGLRFTQISQAGREQIRKWLLRLRTEAPPIGVPEEPEVADEEPPEEQEGLVPQLVAAGGPLPVRPNHPAPHANGNGLDRVARFVSKARAYRPNLSIRATATADSKLLATPALAPMPASEPLKATEPFKATEPLTVNGSEPAKARSYRSMLSLDIGPAKTADSVDSKFSPLSFRGLESLVELVPLQRYLSAKKRQLLCGIVLGIGLSALVMLPAMKFWNSRTHADTKPAVADSASLKNNAPTSPAIAGPASDPIAADPVAKPKSSYPVGNVFSDSAPVAFKKGATSNLTAKNRLADLYRSDPPKTIAAKVTQQTAAVSSQKALASQKTVANQKQPDGNSAAGKKFGTNVNQLWTSVQAGDAKAAVELAELYIKGDGVPQNCQQARVLLLVASEKRNTAAIKRLQQLDRDSATCP